MRKYPQNSPQAAARIIALTIIADGDVNHAEFELLDRLEVHRQLGLERDALHEVFDMLCVDLLANRHLEWAGSCPVDEYTLAGLMGEIDDPALRRRVMALCVQMAEVDKHVDAGESAVLVAAVEHWGLHRHMLRVADAGPALQAA
jgi:hypothetical protein